MAPLQALARTARQISETDLSRRIPVRGNDEIAELGRTLNAMLDRLETAFADQREFLADVSHELRTPITVIRGHIETLGEDPRERREAVTVIQDELDRMNRFVDDLLLLVRASRPDFLRPEPLDLDLFTHEVFAKARLLGDRAWVLEGTGLGPDQRRPPAPDPSGHEPRRERRQPHRPRRADLDRKLAGRRRGAALGARRGARASPPRSSG